MKKIRVALMAMIFAGMAVSAQAATVTFNPGSVPLTVEPGNSAVANLVVTANSRTGYTIYLKVGSVLAPGSTLPASWLKPANVGFQSRGGTSTARMNLAVNVPAGTTGGKYTAIIAPEVMQTTEDINSTGLTVTVEVLSQKKCDGVLNFKNVQVGPENIWAPKSREVEIKISGTVAVTPECKVKGTYSMEFNDSPVSGDLVLDDDGNFDQKIIIIVSKQGIEKEGKIYNGKLAVVDADGNSVSQGFFVKVDHDKGKKKGLNKN